MTDTFEYGYDTNGRLNQVKKNSVIVESYSYDPNGNRLSEMNSRRGINRSYSVSDEDHVLTAGTETYQFDADGFLTTKTAPAGAMTTTYSSRGELLSATLPSGSTIIYDHDPMGRRIAKRVNEAITEKYLWKDAITLLAVYDASDNLLMRFNYADGRLPASMIKNGLTYYLHYDNIGSLKGVTDNSGNMIKKIDYDSFGNTVNDTNPVFTIPFGFAGGLQDSETKLIRFGARDYDPSIGRWTAKDPIDFDGGDTNLYGYVANDPVDWVDPEGLDATNWFNTQGSRSLFNGPTNGNWGGKCWSGGQYSCNKNGLGNAPPMDSGDECYQRHDSCYTRRGTNNMGCDRELVDELQHLPNDPRLWPRPPRSGTEGDSRRFRDWAIRYFR